MRMRFSMKTEYGVRAILELAAHSGRGALQSAEIARRQGIPGPFLDQVLMTLRRAGMITSIRGPHGGHALARGAEEIRLDEVDRASGYWITRSDVDAALRERTSGVYLRASPNDMRVLDGGDAQARADLLAQRLREWTAIVNT